MSRPYRWTRARYYRAHHLLRRNAYGPHAVPRVAQLLEAQLAAAGVYRGDPLLTPLLSRLLRAKRLAAGDDDEIPF